ncbi:MAG: transposase [Proteobacteria bacterium]|nr:transposase [Pseudomonadota bacterium]
MKDATFFTHPIPDWQRRYEALRASFVDRLPARIVAQRFRYSPQYVRLLRHLFTSGKLDFSEPVPEGLTARRRIDAATRQKIKTYRTHQLSSGDIVECLSDEGAEISVRTVERVLREEGFPKLPRRARLRMKMTVKGAHIPEKSKTITTQDLEGQQLISSSAGLFLFAPFLAQFDLDPIIQSAGLPGSQIIPAKSYLLSFLALKLLGTERYDHVGDHAFDPGLGAFAGLNVIPKCTALSTYSYSLDEVHLLRLQEAFVKQGHRLRLYDGKIINLDFHTVPHYGEESILEEHWAGARGKTMKGALTLFAQDADTKLMLYTTADIRRSEANDQVFAFLSFWKNVHRGLKPTLVFDSKFTGYAQLSKLNQQNIKFLTLRRRGENLIHLVDQMTPWKRIHIPHPKRKFPNPLVHESWVSLRHYEGRVRQIVVRENGHDKPAFLITNDSDSPLELLVANYARRWRVENGIAEAVKFFHLNALSSPILIKIHFDVLMTMMADTLYTMLARHLRGFEECDGPTLYRHFIQGKGTIEVSQGKVNLFYPRRAHNPILRAVPWHLFPRSLPGLNHSELTLHFE